MKNRFKKLNLKLKKVQLRYMKRIPNKIFINNIDAMAAIKFQLLELDIIANLVRILISVNRVIKKMKLISTNVNLRY